MAMGAGASSKSSMRICAYQLHTDDMLTNVTGADVEASYRQVSIYTACRTIGFVHTDLRATDFIDQNVIRALFV